MERYSRRLQRLLEGKEVVSDGEALVSLVPCDGPVGDLRKLAELPLGHVEGGTSGAAFGGGDQDHLGRIIFVRWGVKRGVEKKDWVVLWSDGFFGHLYEPGPQ